MPPEASGLLAAVAAALQGRDDAYLRWSEQAQPLVLRALRRAGFDAASSDDALTHLIERAFSAARTMRPVECEPAWMSTVLAHAWARRQRQLRRERAMREAAAYVADTSSGPEIVGELREEFEHAVRRLPARLALAIRLRLRDLDQREVRHELTFALGVGAEQAGKLDRLALAAMHRAIAARDAAG